MPPRLWYVRVAGWPLPRGEWCDNTTTAPDYAAATRLAMEALEHPDFLVTEIKIGLAPPTREELVPY